MSSRPPSPLASRKSLIHRTMLKTIPSCHSEPKAKNLSFIVTGPAYSLRRVLDRSFTVFRMTKKGVLAVESPFLISLTPMCAGRNPSNAQGILGPRSFRRRQELRRDDFGESISHQMYDQSPKTVSLNFVIRSKATPTYDRNSCLDSRWQRHTTRRKGFGVFAENLSARRPVRRGRAWREGSGGLGRR